MHRRTMTPQSPPHRLHLLFLLPLLLPPPPVIAATDRRVGIMYRVDIPGIPPPPQVVAALKKASIPRVRLVNANPSAIEAFVDSGIDINLSIQNATLFTALGSSSTFALDWVNSTIAPTHPSAGISSISVGFGILVDSPELSPLILPAVTNVYYACKNLSLANIAVVSGHSFKILTTAFPPSSAEFSQSVLKYLKPLLDFYEATNAPFQINLFPFEVFRSRQIQGVTTSFVMFEAWEDDYLVDPVTKCTYPNLFAVMVDAAVMALFKLKHPGMPLEVIGTGWPSAGDPVTEPEASELFAAEYNDRLVNLLNMKVGTPLRQNYTPVTYIYALFDEPRRKSGESYDNHWGIWLPDLTVKYTVDFDPSNNNEIEVDYQESEAMAVATKSGSAAGGTLQVSFLWVVGFLVFFLIG